MKTVDRVDTEYVCMLDVQCFWQGIMKTVDRVDTEYV
jgi:hypothetical protein